MLELGASAAGSLPVNQSAGPLVEACEPILLISIRWSALGSDRAGTIARNATFGSEAFDEIKRHGDEEDRDEGGGKHSADHGRSHDSAGDGARS